MNFDEFVSTEMAEHADVLARTEVLVREPLIRLVKASAAALRAGNKLMFFGNGGSAADAQHLATELSVRYIKDRAPIAAMALTTDSSALTAIGNDLGFDQLFARQIRALGHPGDVAIAISTSGRSSNIILALQTVREMGIMPAAFSGKGGGNLLGLADPLLIVPSNTTARIQEMHIILGHMFCGALERELNLV